MPYIKFTFAIIVILFIVFGTTAQPLVSISDYEKTATSLISQYNDIFLNTGAQEDQTARANVNAFKEYRIVTHYLTDVTNQSTETTILGRNVSFPVGISASSGRNRWRTFQPNGELQMLEGAKRFGTIITQVSSLSSITLEGIADAYANELKWFQMYIFTNKNVTIDMLRRAEKGGYNAVVLTIDAQLPFLRYSLERLNATDSEPTPNYDVYGGREKSLSIAKSATIEDIKWFRTLTTLPIVIKGMIIHYYF